MRFRIVTLGCKVNTYESEVIKEKMLNAGYEEVDSYADVVIINTCTVTNNADNKSLKLIRSTKRESPGSIVVVCGCMAQNKGEALNDLGIDILIGNEDKSRIVDLIKEFKSEGRRIVNFYDFEYQKFEDMRVNKFSKQVRAFIKIQDGCDNYCSYCIIPYVRGHLRSKDFKGLVYEAKELAKHHKEIVLTGIHTGSYGIGTDHDLSDVINTLKGIDGLYRIRVSSIEVTEINEKFLRELETNYKLCNHLHIPLQAGDDRILSLMNRKYDTKEYLRIINSIRLVRPDISITTDVIVGFPGETDEEFKNTVEFCKLVGFSKIHVFPYSKRDGTASATMEGHLSNEVKKSRVNELIKVSNDLEEMYDISNKGKIREVLIERVFDGYSIGHTKNYLLVKINEELNVNELVSVRISGFEGKKIIGKIVKEGE